MRPTVVGGTCKIDVISNGGGEESKAVRGFSHLVG